MFNSLFIIFCILITTNVNGIKEISILLITTNSVHLEFDPYESHIDHTHFLLKF
jgi:hypothetical protein